VCVCVCVCVCALGNPVTPSGADGELVLLAGLLDPGPQAGLVEGLDERQLGGVVLRGHLLGVVVGAGLQHLDPQDGGQLERDRGARSSAWGGVGFFRFFSRLSFPICIS